MRKLFSVVMLGVLAACGEGPADNLDTSENSRSPRRRVVAPGVPLKASLQAFTGATACHDLELAIEDEAVARMTYQVEQNRASSLQWREWQAGGPVDSGAVAGSGGGAGGGAGGAGGSAGPNAYTTTNTQVSGIDESDFVKNDGTRMFVISGNTLRALRTWPADALSNAGSIELKGRPKELFLEGDHVLVYSLINDGELPDWCNNAENRWCEGPYWGDYYSNTTVATLLDVSNLDQLRVVATWKLPGRFHNARKVGTRVITVLNERHPDAYMETYASIWGTNRVLTETEINLAYDELLYRNEQTLRARSLTDWLSTGAFTGADGVEHGEVMDCSSVYVPNASTQFGAANVLSFDLAAPAPASRTTVFSRAEELYMSFDALYITQRHYWWSWAAASFDATYVHKFSLSNPAQPAYEASGIVLGFIADQFSMDELNGDLRIAHTERDSSWRTTNRVSVLRSSGGVLTTVGQTPALAPGERIMSARFVGDTAYVVTFRQTDPLYTIDLSDPLSPSVVGELKIPGFSSYIHPLDENHLLTIGSYIPETGAWNERAVQLTIFDVSNKAAPVQKFVELVGDAYASGAAQSDHRAFNYFADKKVLAIPFHSWGTSGYSYTSDLRLFGVDAATGFKPMGKLAVDDLLVRNNCDVTSGCWSWWWEPKVRRSVMADDFVYAVTTGGVRVARTDSLASPVATASFPYSP